MLDAIIIFINETAWASIEIFSSVITSEALRFIKKCWDNCISVLLSVACMLLNIGICIQKLNIRHLRVCISMVFYVEAKIPEVKAQDWCLNITGGVKNPLTFSLNQLKNKFEPKSVQTNIICLRGVTIGGTWTGVQLNQLLVLAQAPDRGWVQVKAYSGYSEPIRLQDCKSADVIVAFELNGKPVPPEQGGLLRLIVPQKYAYKSVKWVREFELLSKRPSGFWEKKGYPYMDSIG